jgi:ATP-dependent Clp protease ATP-binding subunit ClpA
MGVNSRFSQHARRTLSQARLLAQDYQHDEIDTDHLLLGILYEKGSLGFQVLNELAVDVRLAELEVRVLHAVNDPAVAFLNLTRALRRVLSVAAEESHNFGHRYIGTEHLLLALSDCRDGAVAELMQALNLNPEKVRRRVRLLLNDGISEVNLEITRRMARLSELSRRVLNAAAQLADDRPVGLGDLLLVLAREQRSIVSRLLRANGLQHTSLAAAVAASRFDLHLSTRASESALEDVIDHAVDLAGQLETHYTGTEHLLLALTLDPDGIALLEEFGVNRDSLVAAVYATLSS